jgi:hypothetical protein
MTISIPAGLFDKYREEVDLMMTNDHFSRLCTLYFPPIRESCTTCNVALQGGNSTNVFQHGGPAPIGNTGCVYCGGNGYRETETTDTIRLRIFHSKKNWIKVADIVVPDAEVQVMGYSSDLPKFLRADSIQLVSEQKEFEQYYSLVGEPFFHGFGKNRYFVAFLKRA